MFERIVIGRAVARTSQLECTQRCVSLKGIVNSQSASCTRCADKTFFYECAGRLIIIFVTA